MAKKSPATEALPRRTSALDRDLPAPESFGPQMTIRQGIADLSRLAQDTMLWVRTQPALPPNLVMDVYKMACLAKSIDEATGASKALESQPIYH